MDVKRPTLSCNLRRIVRSQPAVCDYILMWICLRIADDPGGYRGRRIDRQLSRFSSSNSDSVARTSEAAFRLYPASSFMSQRIFGERFIRSANFFDSHIASGMMASCGSSKLNVPSFRCKRPFAWTAALTWRGLRALRAS